MNVYLNDGEQLLPEHHHPNAMLSSMYTIWYSLGCSSFGVYRSAVKGPPCNILPPHCGVLPMLQVIRSLTTQSM